MDSPDYFEIQADDPEQAIGFYTAVFGWRFTKQMGLPTDSWRIQTEGMRGGLLKRPADAPPFLKDFDATAGAILRNGGQLEFAANVRLADLSGVSTEP